ncbi:hypothetical protein FGB62_126g01 [Gracilaria domingensis]|nr:hypothetical protein FGB62_126g01 [Gracilaria domingensis]
MFASAPVPRARVPRGRASREREKDRGALGAQLHGRDVNKLPAAAEQLPGDAGSYDSWRPATELYDGVRVTFGKRARRADDAPRGAASSPAEERVVPHLPPPHLRVSHQHVAHAAAAREDHAPQRGHLPPHVEREIAPPCVEKAVAIAQPLKLPQPNPQHCGPHAGAIRVVLGNQPHPRLHLVHRPVRRRELRLHRHVARDVREAAGFSTSHQLPDLVLHQARAASADAVSDHSVSYAIRGGGEDRADAGIHQWVVAAVRPQASARHCWQEFLINDLLEARDVDASRVLKQLVVGPAGVDLVQLGADAVVLAHEQRVQRGKRSRRKVGKDWIGGRDGDGHRLGHIDRRGDDGVVQELPEEDGEVAQEAAVEPIVPLRAHDVGNVARRLERGARGGGGGGDARRVRLDVRELHGAGRAPERVLLIVAGAVVGADVLVAALARAAGAASGVGGHGAEQLVAGAVGARALRGGARGERGGDAQREQRGGEEGRGVGGGGGGGGGHGGRWGGRWGGRCAASCSSGTRRRSTARPTLCTGWTTPLAHGAEPARGRVRGQAVRGARRAQELRGAGARPRLADAPAGARARGRARRRLPHGAHAGRARRHHARARAGARHAARAQGQQAAAAPRERAPPPAAAALRAAARAHRGRRHVRRRAGGAAAAARAAPHDAARRRAGAAPAARRRAPAVARAPAPRRRLRRRAARAPGRARPAAPRARARAAAGRPRRRAPERAATAAAAEWARAAPNDARRAAAAPPADDGGGGGGGGVRRAHPRAAVRGVAGAARLPAGAAGGDRVRRGALWRVCGPRAAPHGVLRHPPAAGQAHAGGRRLVRGLPRAAALPLRRHRARVPRRAVPRAARRVGAVRRRHQRAHV